jgi:hypothetical protein
LSSRMLTTTLALVGLVVGVCPAGAADVYFEQETTARFNDQPGRRVVSRVWHSGERMRVETGAPGETTVLILRLDTQQAFRLDPQARLAMPLDLAELRARSHLELATAGDLMGGAEARSQPLEAGREIAGHRCRGVRIRSGNTVMDLYLTDELPVGIEVFTRLLEWSGAELALPGILAEVRPLSGFPMQTRTRVQIAGGTQETIATVTAVQAGPIPAEQFEPPADFEVVEEPRAPE